MFGCLVLGVFGAICWSGVLGVCWILDLVSLGFGCLCCCGFCWFGVSRFLIWVAAGGFCYFGLGW